MASQTDKQATFRARWFPDATPADWDDWRWQHRRRLRPDALATVLQLSDAEKQGIAAAAGRKLPVAVTPYYASLIDPADPTDPLRRTVIPAPAEGRREPGEMADPLAEDSHSPVPGIVHRYPDRALLLATERCPTYCRYCTRSRLVGRPGAPAVSRWQAAVDYLAATPEVRDVLISGGEPFICSDRRLEWLLQRLHRIPHLDMIRIGTKAPAVMPQRFTPALCDLLRRFPPLFLSIHVIHPRELTPAMTAACDRLAEAGVVMGSQTVLLRGVNDSADTMRRLTHALLRARVRPYYLLQCDPVPGSARFRTPVATGIEIIRALRGHTSGYAVPHFIVDAPGGGGKVSLQPDYVVGHENGALLIRNYEGDLYRYPDPPRPPES